MCLVTSLLVNGLPQKDMHRFRFPHPHFVHTYLSYTGREKGNCSLYATNRSCAQTRRRFWHFPWLMTHRYMAVSTSRKSAWHYKTTSCHPHCRCTAEKDLWWTKSPWSYLWETKLLWEMPCFYLTQRHNPLTCVMNVDFSAFGTKVTQVLDPEKCIQPHNIILH